MKKAIVVALAIVVLPLNLARAEDKTTSSPSAASFSGNQILPPDVLVKNVLLPTWRADFVLEVKTWHKQGSAILDQVTVVEDEQPEPFAEVTCEEKERAAPLVQDRPFGSADL